MLYTTLYLSNKGNAVNLTAKKVGAQTLHIGDERFTRVYAGAADKNAKLGCMRIAYTKDNVVYCL
jgi:hypothetical protein